MGSTVSKLLNHSQVFEPLAHYILFVEYKDLVSLPEKIISKIYSFCGWAKYKHNFNKIETYFKEDDVTYGVDSMHKIVGEIA